LKKGTFWKVTKDTIDTENDELFNCARSKLKVQIRIFALERETSCTYQKKEKLKQRGIQE
jgi:hypothetical protein